MARLVRLCAASDVPAEGQVIECETPEGVFCVARVNGAIAVLDNACPHQEGPLGQGMVENGRVVCPWHAWAFDVKTGEAEHDASEKVRVYESRLEGDSLSIVLN